MLAGSWHFPTHFVLFDLYDLRLDVLTFQIFEGVAMAGALRCSLSPVPNCPNDTCMWGAARYKLGSSAFERLSAIQRPSRTHALHVRNLGPDNEIRVLTPAAGCLGSSTKTR
jgi:hypothetical protein